MIYLYLFAIKVFSFFDKKARMWIEGRKNQILPVLQNKKVIWMHCASLGEFEQGRPVFEKLKKINRDAVFVLTFFSPSGYEKIKNTNIADYTLYLPIDLSSRVEEFIEKINPELAIFVKYDFWYNYLKTLNKKKINTVFISVLLDKTHRLLKSYNNLLLHELKKIRYIFTQDDTTVKLLKDYGFGNAIKAGDTRIERVLEIAKTEFEDNIIRDFCTGNRKILIAGSTWKKDIKILASQQKLLFKKYKFIFAPHEISKEQINYLMKSFKNTKIDIYSDYSGEKSVKSDILIIDIIGILSKIYRYADLVYIGGGFGDGIHNTLEPAAYLKPVIFGPKYQKFYEARRLVEAKSFFSIKNSSELKEIVLSLESEKVYKKTVSEISAFFESNKGATDIIVEKLDFGD